jgi:hypothetical protein
MMKIKLIAPREPREDTLSSPFKLQRVNLPLLAALTPPGHTMTIVDEAFAPDDMNQDVDWVGITVMTDLGLNRNAATLSVLIDPIFRFSDYLDLLHLLPVAGAMKFSGALGARLIG